MTSVNTPPSSAEDDYRLPRDVSPRRYELHLTPNLTAATFAGDERVELEVHEPTRRIVMNARELEVDLAMLTAGWGSAGDAEGARRRCAVRLEPDSERVVFELPDEVAPGHYTLSCTFTGILNDRLRGFYRSTYVDDRGDTHVIATTQFEETAARRAFPCFDEPDRKAVFAVTLDAPPGTIALSNGPEVDSEPLPDGGRRVRFGETIPMSTYIVAFIVGPLEITEAEDVSGTPMRIAYPTGRGHLTRPALDASAHALGFFADYFAIAYPGDKLDLVALPDFAAGAMENLGCVTFREARVLADPESTSSLELEGVVEVVDHELAHMWFGDLVTMRWWNGIWLNEAFATYMALCCEDDYRPDWRVFTSFARSRATALAIDGLHATRPVEYPVRQPGDAAAMFDTLTYEKGAGVLWMLDAYLGGTRFRDGVRRYLAEHAYGNTETTDLWAALEAVSPEVPVREVMATWLLQGGYPLVRASLVGDAGERTVELSAEPFAYLPADVAEEIGTAPKEGSAIGSGWQVPILVGELAAEPGETRGEPRRLLLAGSDRISSSGPLVLNAGGSGYYRVAYDAPLFTELLGRLDELSALERFNLLADAWATTLAGQRDLTEFAAVLRRFAADREPHVWSVAAGALTVVDAIAGDDERAALQRYVRELAQPALERVGWQAAEEDSEEAALLRATLVSLLGTTGADPDVVARARELFAEDHFGGVPLDRNLTSAVLGVVAAHANDEELAASLERFRHPRDPMDGTRHLYALARLTDERLARKVLDLTLTSMRTQNAPILLGGMLANRAIGPLTFGFVRDHFDEMLNRFPDNLIPRMLEGLAGLAQLDEEGRPRYAPDVRAFCRDAVPPNRRRQVSQSLERLEVHVRLAQRSRGRVVDALAAS